MHIIVQRIPNKPVDSNSFIIYCQESSSCIIVDPGTEDCHDLIEFLEEKELSPEYIFLTHEHFDHIWGVNKLKVLYDAKIVCSKDCAIKIIDKKKNMSVFYNKVGFETYPADILIEDLNYRILFLDNIIEFISTPGHTDGSICILIKDNLFTGDLIIRNLKTVIKLPGGSKSNLYITMEMINKRFNDQQVYLHSGHGESFICTELELKRIQI